MLKIGEFSKLSMLTVKTLRFYEKEGLIEPVSVDAWTGYRLYETAQLQLAARIKAYRQLGLSVAQTREILDGADEKPILLEHARNLQKPLGHRQPAERKRHGLPSHRLGNSSRHRQAYKERNGCLALAHPVVYNL